MLFFIFFPGFEVGREVWEGRKEEVEDWQGSARPSGMGRGKSLGDSGTLLGHHLLSDPFLPQDWLRVMLPVERFE